MEQKMILAFLLLLAIPLVSAYGYNNLPADLVTSGNLSWNQTLANTLYADIMWGYNQTQASSGDNSSWNQTHADLLYSKIVWDYNQTLAGDNRFVNIDGDEMTGQLNASGFSTGAILSEQYDLIAGDNLGAIKIGETSVSQGNFTVASLNFNGTMIFRNIMSQSPIQFAWATTTNLIRFAIPVQGDMFATYNPRSQLIGGVLNDTFDNQIVNCTAQGYSFIDCDTSTTGADLGVEDDLEVGGSTNVSENVTANFYHGDGSQLTGVIAGKVGQGPYLFSNTSTIEFNDTFANATYDSKYINRTGDIITGDYNITVGNIILNASGLGTGIVEGQLRMGPNATAAIDFNLQVGQFRTWRIFSPGAAAIDVGQHFFYATSPTRFATYFGRNVNVWTAWMQLYPNGITMFNRKVKFMNDTEICFSAIDPFSSPGNENDACQDGLRMEYDSSNAVFGMEKEFNWADDFLYAVDDVGGGNVSTGAFANVSFGNEIREDTVIATLSTAGAIDLVRRGWYKIDVDLSTEGDTGTDRSGIEFRIFDVTNGIPLVGSSCWTYNRDSTTAFNTCSINVMIEATAGQDLVVQGNRYDGATEIQMAANGSRLRIEYA